MFLLLSKLNAMLDVLTYLARKFFIEFNLAPPQTLIFNSLFYKASVVGELTDKKV